MGHHWNQPLPRTLTLKDGAQIASLRDAGDLLSSRFPSLKRQEGVERAITLLIRAAETGAVQDSAAASVEIETVLRGRGLI